MMMAHPATVEPIPWVPGPIWDGETVAIIASGPSLSAEQVDCIQCFSSAMKVIAINTSYKLAPWADVLYACDFKWWRWNNGAPDMDLGAMKVTIDKQAALTYGLKYLNSAHDPGLSNNPGTLHTGQNSGFQAINLAVNLGAKRLLLVGYDMRVHPSGQCHWHGKHPDGIVSNFQRYVSNFNALVPDLKARGIDVVNCTPDSAIRCFDFGDICEICMNEL